MGTWATHTRLCSEGNRARVRGAEDREGHGRGRRLRSSGSDVGQVLDVLRVNSLRGVQVRDALGGSP